MSEVRQPIHAAVQEAMSKGHADGAILTGWVCIAESMDTKGIRSLSMVSADASGDRRLPRWTEQGLLHNGLHGDGQEGWDHGDDDDD